MTEAVILFAVAIAFLIWAGNAWSNTKSQKRFKKVYRDDMWEPKWVSARHKPLKPAENRNNIQK